MRNVGVIVFIIGLLLLILSAKVIDFIGVIGIAFGLFAFFAPDKASGLVDKFRTKKTDNR